jgi:uncharacterized integral membrane protein
VGRFVFFGWLVLLPPVLPPTTLPLPPVTPSSVEFSFYSTCPVFLFLFLIIFVHQNHARYVHFSYLILTTRLPFSRHLHSLFLCLAIHSFLFSVFPSSVFLLSCLRISISFFDSVGRSLHLFWLLPLPLFLTSSRPLSFPISTSRFRFPFSVTFYFFFTYILQARTRLPDPRFRTAAGANGVLIGYFERKTKPSLIDFFFTRFLFFFSGVLGVLV